MSLNTFDMEIRSSGSMVALMLCVKMPISLLHVHPLLSGLIHNPKYPVRTVKRALVIRGAKRELPFLLAVVLPASTGFWYEREMRYRFGRPGLSEVHPARSMAKQMLEMARTICAK